MKNRFTNYLIIAANIITFIGLIIAFAIFLQLDQGGDNKTNDQALAGTMVIGYIPMIVCCIIATIFLAIHQFYTLRELKYRSFHVDPKLARAYYYAPLIVLINIIISFLLFIVIDEIGLQNYVPSLDSDKKLAIQWVNNKTYVFIVAMLFSGLSGLVSIGIVSYMQLKIAYDVERKKQAYEKLQKPLDDQVLALEPKGSKISLAIIKKQREAAETKALLDVIYTKEDNSTGTSSDKNHPETSTTSKAPSSSLASSGNFGNNEKSDKAV